MSVCGAAELELDQARYEAERSFRQYDVSDPENRLVTGELERRWNEALARVTVLEARLSDLSKAQPRPTDVGGRELLALASDITAVWHDVATDMRLKKRIVRTLVEEIVTDVNAAGDTIQAVIHWKGGVHSTRQIRKNATGHRRASAEKTTEIIAQMAARFSDEDIALTLNRLGLRTGMGLTWNAVRVKSYRSYHDLPAHDSRDEAPTELVTLSEAAEILGVCAMTVRRLIARGAIPTTQAAPTVPWSIKRSALDEPRVREAVEASKNYRPLTSRRNTKNLRIPGM